MGRIGGSAHSFNVHCIQWRLWTFTLFLFIFPLLYEPIIFYFAILEMGGRAVSLQFIKLIKKILYERDSSHEMHIFLKRQSHEMHIFWKEKSHEMLKVRVSRDAYFLKATASRDAYSAILFAHAVLWWFYKNCTTVLKIVIKIPSLSLVNFLHHHHPFTPHIRLRCTICTCTVSFFDVYFNHLSFSISMF